MSVSPHLPPPSMAQFCPGQSLVWESVFLWASAETLLPFQEALIHLGAKFAPCMRQDQQVHSFIRAAREKEKHSACCVRNDKSGCVQTAEEECSVSWAHCLFLLPSFPLACPLLLGGEGTSWGPCSRPLLTLCFTVHFGRVGEVAKSPEHSFAGKRQEEVWLCVSPRPQVGWGAGPHVWGSSSCQGQRGCCCVPHIKLPRTPPSTGCVSSQHPWTLMSGLMTSPNGL